MKVISNTGPIIGLYKIGILDILNKLFNNIYISEAVFNEIMNTKYLNTIQIQDYSWIKVEANKSVDPLLLNELDYGEATAISLAMFFKADLLIIDERKGRRIAEQVYGIEIIGIAGILLKAKLSGYISEVTKFFNQLLQEKYYISNDIIQDICSAAGE
ncbi:MAG: DUF3368 domain-containing protein [Leptospiraceae bacterium]|nr:DUF3368 domain-containing protein [Leptospiraceae bacterium]MCP5494565.1 DUF3368 domain-containing protein [Leptospiraceae bacterium]